MRPASVGNATGRLIGELLLAAVALDRVLMRGRERGRSFCRGVFSEALSGDELEDLMVRFYARGPNRFTGKSLEGWEARMFDCWLPPPPAHVLVTAAGSGREVRALIERGYTVDALEPAPAMAAACAAVKDVGTVVCATHADLAAAVSGEPGRASSLAGRRYDAVLVGWGSLNHVFSRARRRALLEACDRLAPSGPILLSFFAQRRDPPERERILAAGRRLGRHLAKLRGVTPPEAEVRFAWNVGFTHASTSDEVAALAASVGRVAEVVLEPYGHAVLRPGGR